MQDNHQITTVLRKKGNALIGIYDKHGKTDTDVDPFLFCQKY